VEGAERGGKALASTRSERKKEGHKGGIISSLLSPATQVNIS